MGAATESESEVGGDGQKTLMWSAIVPDGWTGLVTVSELSGGEISCSLSLQLRGRHMVILSSSRTTDSEAKALSKLTDRAQRWIVDYVTRQARGQLGSGGTGW